MNRTSHLLLLAALCLLTACSPRISTTVIKTYPSLHPTDSVTLFEYGDEAPASSEVLAKVKMKDNGFTKNCRYSQIIGLAKEEARRLGGDGLQVIDHILPHTKGSTCYQMEGAVIRLQPNDSTGTQAIANDILTLDNFLNDYQNSFVERSQISPYEIALNIGYGYMYDDLGDEYTPEEKSLYDQTTSGLSWDAQFLRYYRSGLGWGLIYSGYHSNATIQGDKYSTGITYLAPMFAGRIVFEKWILKAKIGIGYLNSSLTGPGYDNHELTISKPMVGTNTTIGADYRVSGTFTLGAEMGTFNGNFTEKMDGKLVTYGASRLYIHVGARFYFGKKR